MFNLQGSELVIILLLALVVLGPEKLPDAMRRMGRFYGELKKMSTGFQQEFRSAVEEPVREFRATADVVRDSVDFRKLQDGERAEKPKSGEMPVVGDVPGEPGAPTADVPFERPVETTTPASTPLRSVDDVAGLREARPMSPESDRAASDRAASDRRAGSGS